MTLVIDWRDSFVLPTASP